MLQKLFKGGKLFAEVRCMELFLKFGKLNSDSVVGTSKFQKRFGPITVTLAEL